MGSEKEKQLTQQLETLKQEVVEGQNIVSIWTLGSGYDNNSVAVRDDKDNIYRIKVPQFLKIINGVKFSKVKKRINTYLEVVE